MAYNPGLPTLIIGVGGTGLRVLQRVKERLLETYYGEIPPEITLLEFDTALQSPADNFCGVQLTQELSQLGSAGSTRISEMQLIQTTPSYTMDNAFREAREGDPRWSWLEVDKLERLLPPAARSILDGAGAFRPVGRTAFFLNYHDVERRLRDAMRQVRDVQFQMSSEALKGVADSQQVQKAMSKRNVFLVGSLAGGTGSGGILDIAAMMRSIKETDTSFTDIVLIGMIALPRFFAQINDDLGRRVPNSYAGLRELDRFMRAHTPGSPYTFTTGNHNQVDINNILFDLCYLVDTEDYHNKLPRNLPNPDFGALPAMADLIVAHTDLRLGLRLNASNVNFTANYALPLKQLGVGDHYSYQSRRYYSGLNCHTIIFPREDVAKSLSLHLLLDLIDEHLLARDARTNQLIVPSEPMRVDDLVALLGNNNPTPQEKLAAELNAPEGDLDMGIFVRTLIHTAQTPDRRFTTEVESVLRWLVEDGVQRKNVQKVIDDSLRQISAQPSDPANMGMYIGKVRGWLDRFLGPLVDDNNPLGDRKGGDWEQAFGNLVTKARAATESRVQTLVLRILNQRRQEVQGDETTSIMRANRVGYALAVLRLIKQAVRVFIKQSELSFGETSRNLIRLRSELEEKRTVVANFKGGFLRRNPGPEYLSALKDVAETERQRLLRNLTIQMAEQFGGDIAQEGRSRSVIDEAIFELEGWGRALLRVREIVAEERGRHEERRKQKYAIGVRTYLTDPQRSQRAGEIEDELYRRYRPVVWRTLLGPDPMGGSGPGFYWAPRAGSAAYFDYEIVTKEKAFRLNPKRPDDTTIALLLGEGSGAEVIAARWREGALRLMAEQVRGDQQARVAAYIPRLYNQQQTPLVNTILEPSSHALVRLNGIQATPQQEEHYLAVDWTSADRQVNAFYGWFDQHWTRPNQAFLQSESDVACTFLTLYHGLELDQVVGFVECEPAYRSMNRAQGCLHLFPEERLGADYEARIATFRRPEWREVKRLHPEVVVGLGDAQHVRSFVLAVVSGLIADEETEANREHFLKLPGEPPLRLTQSSQIDNYGLMRPNDQIAARLLQAFHSYMLIGHSVDNEYETIDYEAVGTTFRDWLVSTHGDVRGSDLDRLLKTWETDRAGPSLFPLLNAESKDPRFRDLGIVLLIELTTWRSQRK